MMVTTKTDTCPDPEVLTGFLLGKLSTVELETIARHLGTCSRCTQKAQSLETRTDVLVDTLRQALVEDSYAEELACREGSKAVAGRQFSMPSPLPDVSPTSKPLGRLGTYELLEEIGRGGTGVVYRARHTRLKTIVAVKVLPAEALMRPDTLARFDREMAAIGGLDHLHIVRATDAGEDDGQHFLVMEYVEGGDLAALVARQGPLPIAEATSCILQAARGLVYAHAQGMIHRDVKPSNLLLGADGIVKVSDLGLARVLLAVEDDGSTHTGSLMGTFDYMAPEQALNAKEADEQADIYGLGCTLYYLLTGSPPYASKSAFETLIAHREQSVPSARQVRNEVPRPMDRLLQRMLAKAPGNRPPSMEQIVQELEGLRSKGLVEEKDDLTPLLSDTVRQVELKPPRRSRSRLSRRRPISFWVAAIGGAIFGTLLVIAGFLIWPGSDQQLLPPSSSAARFDVRLVQAADGVRIRYISEAVKLLNGDLPSESVTSGRFRFLDFIDPMSSSGGFFDRDLAFPGFEVVGNIGVEDSNHFALKAVATVSVPRPGVWTFCVVSDDGFRLSIDGKIVGEHDPTRTQAATLVPIDLDKAGPHLVELIYFEATGGADFELCAAEGRYDDFDAQAFQLVGSSYETGLTLERPE
ncbi:MAG: protein kinase [Planctomycetes bacterium]|nr:protein kinase [Planctomycetota bacterium]